MVQDHKGNSFPNTTEMCKFWGVNRDNFYERINRLHWDLALALTTPKAKRHRVIFQDASTGAEIVGLSEMARRAGINRGTLHARVRSGSCLPLDPGNQHLIPAKDHLGNQFESLKAMCRFWHIDYMAFRHRLESGKSIDECLMPVYLKQQGEVFNMATFTAAKRKIYAKCSLPLPPTMNRYWRSEKGRVHISDEGKAYNSQIQVLARCSNAAPAPDAFYVRKWRENAKGLQLAVVCHFYLPDNKKRDIDNLFKVLFDSMTKAGVWLDDSQVYEIGARKDLKRQHKSQPRVEMEIYVIHDPEGVPEDD